jgi:hypothetical protein
VLTKVEALVGSIDQVRVLRRPPSKLKLIGGPLAAALIETPTAPVMVRRRALLLP